MKQVWIMLCAVMAGSSVAPGAGGVTASVRDPALQTKPVPVRIVTLGDSITKGTRPGVKPAETFAARLERALRDGGQAVEVINVGIGGERTDLALVRLAKDVVARRPALVTVMYGTNDAYVDKGKETTRLTPAQYRANLEKIVDELKAAGIVPVLMTSPRWGRTSPPNGVGENPNVRLVEYIGVCRGVAVSRKVPLVDHFKHWTEAEAAGKTIGDWTTDQCHPNPEGHRVLVETMLPVIKTVLATLKGSQ
jgi:acyl-CoA thioesterase-1